MKLLQEALAALVLSHAEAADLRLPGSLKLTGPQRLASLQEAISASALSNTFEVSAPDDVSASAPAVPPAILEEDAAFDLLGDAAFDFLGDRAMSMPDEGGVCSDVCKGATGCARQKGDRAECSTDGELSDEKQCLRYAARYGGKTFQVEWCNGTVSSRTERKST